MGFKNGSTEYLTSIKSPKVMTFSLISYFIIKIIERLLVLAAVAMGKQKTNKITHLIQKYVAFLKLCYVNKTYYMYVINSIIIECSYFFLHSRIK